MKTILARLAALPLLAHAVTFGQLECTIKDVKVTNTVGMFTDGDGFHKKRIGKTFFVDRETGLMLGTLSNSFSSYRVVHDMVQSHQSYFVMSHDNGTEGFTGDPLSPTAGADVLHIWISENPEYKKDGYPFTYAPNMMRDFYSGTCREK